VVRAGGTRDKEGGRGGMAMGWREVGGRGCADRDGDRRACGGGRANGME